MPLRIITVPEVQAFIEYCKPIVEGSSDGSQRQRAQLLCLMCRRPDLGSGAYTQREAREGRTHETVYDEYDPLRLDAAPHEATTDTTDEASKWARFANQLRFDEQAGLPARRGAQGDGGAPGQRMDVGPLRRVPL